jgi:hypothetical protein
MLTFAAAKRYYLPHKKLFAAPEKLDFWPHSRWGVLWSTKKGSCLQRSKKTRRFAAVKFKIFCSCQKGSIGRIKKD